MKYLWLICLLPLFVTGCAQDQQAQSEDIRLVPLSNREVIHLDAYDIIQIMRRAGFSNEQILKYGKAMRDGLALSGAVQLKIAGSDKTEATFAVNDSCIYISTRLRGSFVYDMKVGWITPLS